MFPNEQFVIEEISSQMKTSLKINENTTCQSLQEIEKALSGNLL